MLSPNNTILAYPMYVATTMRKTSLRRVACGERWRSPPVDEGLVAAPEHVCLAACPNSSTCHRARRASTPCLGKTWPQYRVATTRTAWRRVPCPPPWPCTQHRACRARVTCGTAHAAGHGQCCAALHEHRHAPLDHDRLPISFCSAQPVHARQLPPAHPHACARTHAHTRVRAHAHGAQAFAYPLQSAAAPRVRQARVFQHAQK